MRASHPSYDKDGGVPAFSEIKFSLISNRGCFGSCSFCALTFHQGRVIQARSHESLVEETKLLTEDKDFKGYIHDVGGPTAVSYTHLDVYKRQGDRRIYTGSSGSGSHYFNKTFGKAGPDGNPVSYTHLDVYKRQAWNSLSSR